MNPVRFGLAVRALRRRRGWTQAQLGNTCGLSQAAVSRLETGEAARSSVEVLDRVAAALGARVHVTVLAHGEDLDRLLDAAHASLVEHVTQLLARHGWEVAPETTFSVYGERGSIDILAFHEPTGALLVIEVKSAIPDVQAALAGIDRKRRLAAGIARERGWLVRSVSAWLVVPGDRTTRRRVTRHEATFRAKLPGGTVALRRWVARPIGTADGILFVTDMPHEHARHRIRPDPGRSDANPGRSRDRHPAPE